MWGDGSSGETYHVRTDGDVDEMGASHEAGEGGGVKEEHSCDAAADHDGARVRSGTAMKALLSVSIRRQPSNLNKEVLFY